MMMMDGPTSSIRPQSPDWRHTHTATAAAAEKYASSMPNPSSPRTYSSSTPTKSHAPLPPLAHLDFAKIRRDDQSNHDAKHLSPITTTTASSLQSLNSPSSGYPGPPPPYSSLVPTTTSSVHTGGYPTYTPQPPSDPRKQQYEEERERQPIQSLPSIHEALRKEPGSYYRAPPQPLSIPPPPPPPPPPAPQQQQSSRPSSIIGASPTTPRHQSHIASQNVHEPHIPSNPPHRPSLDNIHRDSHFEQQRRQPPEHQSAHHPQAPPQSPHTTGRPHTQSQPSTPSFYAPHQSHHGSTSYHPQPPHSSGPPHPPSSQPQYAPSYAPAYSYPPPSSYPNQAHQPHHNEDWRSHDYNRTKEEKRIPPAGNSFNSGQGSPSSYHHGESVKRHLETFDFELGLNEIAEASKRTLDFARKYADKAHHMHRSGIATALPSLDECDEMHNLQRSVLNAMDRIRDIVITQQHALAEQRSREEASKARQASYAEHPDMSYVKEEGGGGFAGPDPKKRRGRHAPPGRCHSCARSETPEWRRGPDGARTLCNACGLHYAKLTRKQGVSAKAPLPGSNLKPAEEDSSQP